MKPKKDKNGFILPIDLSAKAIAQGARVLEFGRFEVVDYSSCFFGHIFEANGAIESKEVQIGVHLVIHNREVKVNGKSLVHIKGGSEPFSFRQIKPIENELIINYVHPIHGNRNHSFPKEELKRASFHYWMKADLNDITINFKPFSYKESKTWKS